MAQANWGYCAQKMASFDQHIARHRHMHAGGWRQQGAIVAYTEHRVLCGALEVTRDQIEFAHVLVQITFGRVVAQCVEHKHRDVVVKLFTLFGNKQITPVHGAGGCAQAGAAGVFKLLAGFEQGLVADHAQSTNFFVQAVGVVHIPGARDQLRGDGAGVGDGDGVGKYIERGVCVRLLGEVLRMDFDLE